MSVKQSEVSILLVEDDPSLVKGLKYTLEKEDFAVFTAFTASEARSFIKDERYNLILMDINLPDGNGFDLCREIRKVSEIPVIFLTACDEEVNAVMGLDLGGDDYITKPFRINELISRIRAVLRRSLKVNDNRNLIISGEISLNRKASRVLKAGRDLQLTSTEYRLVNILLENRGNIVTRERLIELLWDKEEHYIDSNTLSVYIRRLREKMEEDPGNPEYIKTERGFGYRWI